MFVIGNKVLRIKAADIRYGAFVVGLIFFLLKIV